MSADFLETSADVSVAAPAAEAPPAEADAEYYSDAAATLGDRIAAARQKSSLTQAGLAARLGVGAKIVSAWENDRSEPRANRLAMLSGMLGVSVAWLLTGRGEGVEPPTSSSNATAVFHLTVGSNDLDEAKRFYADRLGCGPLRREDAEQHFEFFGGLLTVSLAAGRWSETDALCVSMVLEWDAWTALIERLRSESVEFAMEPTISRVGAPEESGAFRLADPSGNTLQFNAYRDRARVFG